MSNNLCSKNSDYKISIANLGLQIFLIFGTSHIDNQFC